MIDDPFPPALPIGNYAPVVKERDPWHVTKDEVEKYLKNHRRAKASRKVIRQRLRAAKIKNAPGKEVSFSQSDAPWQIIYGTVRVPGVLTFAHITNNNYDLHQVYTIAGHEVQAINYVYLDDARITFDGSGEGVATGEVKNGASGTNYLNVFAMHRALGGPNQDAIGELVTRALAFWTQNHRQRNHAHVYLRFHWNAEKYPENLPDVTFEVQGEKCYDPRTASISFTQNAALCIGDFLMDQKYGCKIPISRIYVGSGSSDEGSLWWAADICDEEVNLVGGGTEARYTLNGYFDASRTRREILEEMLTAMGGSITYSGGLWKFWPAAWRAPAQAFEEGDILGDINVQTHVPRRDSFNAVKGTYASALHNYEETDFPPVTNALYLSQDNDERIWEDIVLPFTTSGSAAQRLAKIALEKQRQQISIEFTAKLKALQCEVPDNITVTYSRFGWTSKAFELIDFKPLAESDENGVPVFMVQISARETAEGVYDWNNGDETTIDLAPNTTLPSASSYTLPTGVLLESGTSHLYIRSDGTVFSRIKVSWDEMTDAFVSSGGFIEIQYKQSSASDWQNASSVPGDQTFTYILDVQDGAQYDVRIRSKSALGVLSPFTDIHSHIVIGKREPPSNVTGFSAQIQQFGILLFWNKPPDLDLSQHEIRIGGSSWETATFLQAVDGTSVFVKMQNAGGYTFWIKAIDTSGNYSAAAASLDTTIAGPGAPFTTFSLSGPNVLFEWTAPGSHFGIDEYLISYGPAYASSIFVASVKGTRYALKAEWSGTRRFWIAAKDVAGNIGTPYQIDINIVTAGIVQNLRSEVIDNFILLRWDKPSASTLPLDHYKVYKGTPFSSAMLIGQLSGTFFTHFETQAGTYTYWVRSFDSAGNAGAELSITATMAQPPDYVLLDNFIVDPSTYTSKANVVTDNFELVGPIKEETWEEHFVDNGWDTPEDQISAGYPYYCQPGAEEGHWEKVIDLGGVVGTAILKLSYVQDDLVGEPNFAVKLAYSFDGASWTEEVGVTHLFSTNFRFVKIRFEFESVSTGSGEPVGVLLSITKP